MVFVKVDVAVLVKVPVGPVGVLVKGTMVNVAVGLEPEPGELGVLPVPQDQVTKANEIKTKPNTANFFIVTPLER